MSFSASQQDYQLYRQATLHLLILVSETLQDRTKFDQIHQLYVGEKRNIYDRYGKEGLMGGE